MIPRLISDWTQTRPNQTVATLPTAQLLLWVCRHILWKCRRTQVNKQICIPCWKRSHHLELTKASTVSVVLSLTKVEYVALSEAAREACWLRNLYGKLGLLQGEVPTLIRGDNKRLIAMAKNPQFHKRSKHIEIRWHWVSNLVQSGKICIESI